MKIRIPFKAMLLTAAAALLMLLFPGCDPEETDPPPGVISATGELDSDFGESGIAVSAVGSGDDVAYAMAVQSDNKVVVVGSGYAGSNQNFTIARYNANGSLDYTFDTDGVLQITTGTIYGCIYSMDIQADGKIVVGGNTALTGVDYEIVLARINTNATLDTSFGTDGLVTLDPSTGVDEVRAVQMLSSGKILAAGTTVNTDKDFIVLRYE